MDKLYQNLLNYLMHCAVHLSNDGGQMGKEIRIISWKKKGIVLPAVDQNRS